MFCVVWIWLVWIQFGRTTSEVLLLSRDLPASDVSLHCIHKSSSVASWDFKVPLNAQFRIPAEVIQVLFAYCFFAYYSVGKYSAFRCSTKHSIKLLRFVKALPIFTLVLPHCLTLCILAHLWIVACMSVTEFEYIFLCNTSAIAPHWLANFLYFKNKCRSLCCIHSILWPLLVL